MSTELEKETKDNFDNQIIAVSQRQPIIIMLVGLPGSGKSFWRENYIKSSTQTTVVISSDDLIEDWGKERGLNYTEAFGKVNHKTINTTMKEIFSNAIHSNYDIIVDRTNMKVKSRNDFLVKIPKIYKKKAIVFSIPDTVLKDRLETREKETGKHIPSYVIDNMANGYETPTTDEFDEIVWIKD